MKNEKSVFNQAFTYLYFLMLSADKIADLSEIELGNKIIKLENLDKAAVMKEIDNLSSMPRKTVLEQGVDFMKSANRETQLKCLGYIRLMAEVDGALDQKEIDLIHEIGVNELHIPITEISAMKSTLKAALDNMS
jgi:hypothetical protein